jgi:hypothetical protein
MVMVDSSVDAPAIAGRSGQQSQRMSEGARIGLDGAQDSGPCRALGCRVAAALKLGNHGLSKCGGAHVELPKI